MTFLDSIVGRYGLDYSQEFTDVIERFAPQASRFLEWGSGETTKLLCEIALKRTDPLVMSIDHHDEYIRAISGSLPLYTFLHFRCLDPQGSSIDQNDRLPSYSSYPYLIGMEFDVIFLDGRRRAECALTASQIISDTGIVILHDWRRSRYAIIRDLFETVCEGEQFLVLRPRDGMRRLHQSRHTSRERRVVIVPASGPRAAQELELTLPSVEAYATRIGADCVVVGQASELPPHRLKYETLGVAQSYDRSLLLDADVMIRDHAPDLFRLVPPDALGAMPEGAYFPRAEWCQELENIYGLERKLPANEYFNTGVLVISSQNYALLADLKDLVIFGHPQFEQGFLNARRIVRQIPLFPLSPDFNYIPFPDAFPVDWRYGFFIHLAGSGKRKYNYAEIWEDKTGARNTFSKRKIMSADTRAVLLRALADQLRGRDAMYFDATDFFYVGPHAFPMFSVSGEVVGYLPGNMPRDHLCLAVYGPYAALPAGKWEAEFMPGANADFRDFDGAYDVSMESGTQIIVPRQPFPQDGRFAFVLERDASDLEVRLYARKSACEFSYLKLERAAATAIQDAAPAEDTIHHTAHEEQTAQAEPASELIYESVDENRGIQETARQDEGTHGAASAEESIAT